MIAPISPLTRNVIFACCLILPATAATAAYPYRGRVYSFIGVIAGLLAIATIGLMLFHLS
jgi:hypothetical protein